MTNISLNHVCQLIIAEAIAKAYYEDTARNVGMIDTSTPQGRENFEILGRIQSDWQETREFTLKAISQLKTS